MILFVLAAAMISTDMILMALAVVMVAGGLGSAGQCACQQLCNPRVCLSLATGIQADARLLQGPLGSAADAATDQGVHLMVFQKARQSTMTAAVGIHDLGRYHRALLHIVQFELGRVAEVLKYLAVLIRDCDFHKDVSFPCWK